MSAMPGSVCRRWEMGPVHLVALLFLLWAFVGVFGCSDNRIPLKQFLETQQATSRGGPQQPHMYSAATQPAAPQPETQLNPQESSDLLPPGTQPAVAPTDQYWSPYKIGPGDTLGVALAGIDQTGVVAPIMVRVNRNGDIDLPAVGKVHVAGLEMQDAEDAIQSKYVPNVYRQASVHVELTKPETISVLVTGAVAQPGLVQLPRTLRDLLHAIGGAGGATNLASGEVLLRRLRTAEEIRYNLLVPEQLQQALTMTPLQNGDVVIVQAAPPNAIFIGGLVMAPHVQVNPPGTKMNVLQALASAGGIRTDVTPLDITLIRRMPDGRDMHVKLDVDRIQHGKDPNIDLAPGDILWVPETLLTKAENWANQNIFIRGGATAVVTYDVTGLSFMNNNAKQAALGSTNSSGNINNTFDPFSSLIQQQQLNNIQNQLPAVRQ